MDAPAVPVEATADQLTADMRWSPEQHPSCCGPQSRCTADSHPPLPGPAHPVGCGWFGSRVRASCFTPGFLRLTADGHWAAGADCCSSCKMWLNPLSHNTPDPQKTSLQNSWEIKEAGTCRGLGPGGKNLSLFSLSRPPSPGSGSPGALLAHFSLFVLASQGEKQVSVCVCTSPGA